MSTIAASLPSPLSRCNQCAVIFCPHRNALCSPRANVSVKPGRTEGERILSIGVQLVVFWHVVSAFRQDASDMTREAEIKEKLKAARAAQATIQSEGASSSKKDS